MRWYYWMALVMALAGAMGGRAVVAMSGDGPWVVVVCVSVALIVGALALVWVMERRERRRLVRMMKHRPEGTES